MNPPPISSPPAKSSSRGCLLYSGIVIVTFLLVFFSACVITYVMPKKFESTAVFQMRPAAYQKSPITPQYLATEFEVIRASLTLKLVVQNLDLTTNWNMTEEDAIAVLRGIVHAQNIRGTDLIQISVKHTGAEDARDIAKEVYEAYKKRREDKESEMLADSLKEMEKAVLDQSDLVEEKRKLRDHTLRRAPYHPGDSSIATPPPDSKVLQIQREAQIEFETQQALLEKMREKLAEGRANQSARSVIELHEEPIVAQYPSSPNVNLNLIMGATLGLLFGLLMALFVRVVFGRRISG
jgi:capsular polysaccharide biosynthesis protein